ncbi:amidase [Novosphingobium umbonatum]|uniref:Amidase n=1 Tax=Novosphingobium umbonatum TaxID=1908524 RepID=A0A3S3TRQ1_9SPHN|nr:amidase [Novosphingobium umbonatum]RVU06963.1 amidase [Novosphingobium umbonatum]
MIDNLDLVGLAEAIAAGDISAEQATAAALSRAQNNHLNAFVRIQPEAAMEAARAADQHRAAGQPLGPLHGVPLAHKDMFYRAGQITGCGSKIRQDFRPDQTCTLLSALDAAGAIEIGQLHMAEFAMGPTGHNAHLGRCQNPWLPDAISGGSSSGSGTSVAARIVAGALGSDTGGSVRLPASFCGVVGLKPTHGRLTPAAMMPLSESLDTAGPLATSSRSVARLMSVLTGEPMESGLNLPLTGLTIGVVVEQDLGDCATETLTALDEAAAALRDLGATIIALRLPALDHYAAMAGLVWAPEAAALHLDHLRHRPQDFGPQVRNRLLHGLSMAATTYVQARRLRAADLAEVMAGPLAQCDVIALPVCRILTPLAQHADADGGPEMDQIIGGLSALTRGFSYLGLPALSTPMGYDPRGLPIGLQLVGRPRAEALLCRVGHAFERATCLIRNPLLTTAQPS